jgi:hypothetical protein
MLTPDTQSRECICSHTTEIANMAYGLWLGDLWPMLGTWLERQCLQLLQTSCLTSRAVCTSVTQSCTSYKHRSLSGIVYVNVWHWCHSRNFPCNLNVATTVRSGQLCYNTVGHYEEYSLCCLIARYNLPFTAHLCKLSLAVLYHPSVQLLLLSAHSCMRALYVMPNPDTCHLMHALFMIASSALRVVLDYLVQYHKLVVLMLIISVPYRSDFGKAQC